MLKGISYRQSIKCPECQQMIPVNHLRTSMLCSNCQRTTDLLQRELTWWTDRMSLFMFTSLLFREPEGHVGGATSGSIHVECFLGPADCPGCRQPMTPDALAAGAASGTYRCTCGFTSSCRDAEPAFVQQYQYARWLVGEAPAAGPAPEASHPMVMQCMSCGGSLHVDGSSRTVDCSFCNTSNYLPDGVWLRLHPAPTMEWFRLVLDIDEAGIASERTRPL